MQRVVILQEYVPQYRVAFFRSLISAAAARGIEVIVMAGKPTGTQAERRDSGDTEFVIPLMQRELKLLGRRVVVRRIPPAAKRSDLVIMEQARRNLDVYGLLLPSILRRRAVALWGHGKDYVSLPSRTSGRILETITSRADWFFSYTEGGKAAVSNIGFPTSRITSVQNSIDSSELRSHLHAVSPNDIELFRRKYGLRHKTGIFLGGLDQSKRLKFLLEAGALIHQTDPDFRLIIVGDGEQRSLVQNAEQIYSWVRYLGAMTGAKKALALAASNVICMPGRVGLVAVDSFESANPIVTTDWPWHAPEYEYLVSNEAGVVSPNNTEDYAKAVLELMTNERKLIELQNNCRTAAEKYTVEEMAVRFLSGIEAALKAGKR